MTQIPNGARGEGAPIEIQQLAETLWRSADALRGQVDATEYKHVVLGLLFLKYISDSFESRQEELKAEGKGRHPGPAARGCCNMKILDRLLVADDNT